MPRSLRATIRGLVILLVSGVSGLVRADAARFPCGEALVLDRAERSFDGAHFQVVVFRAKSCMFVTDTLGAWMVSARDADADGLALRHKTLPGVTVRLCAIARKALPDSDDGWQRFVENVADGLPVAMRDSHTDHGVFPVGGLETREVILNQFDGAGAATRTELRILAVGRSTATCFTLAGSAAAVNKAMPDFRFFLARLEQSGS